MPLIERRDILRTSMVDWGRYRRVTENGLGDLPIKVLKVVEGMLLSS